MLMSNPTMALNLAFLLLFVLTLSIRGAVGTNVEWNLGTLVVPKPCGGSVGECAGADEESSLGSETDRRLLRAVAGRRFISYAALKKNQVPCSRRGRSYYNCMQQGKANPYNRGCTVATRCARDTS